MAEDKNLDEKLERKIAYETDVEFLWSKAAKPQAAKLVGSIEDDTSLNSMIDDKIKSSEKFSYIEPNEEEIAKQFIEARLGFPPPRVTGYHIALMIYTRETLSARDDKANPIIGTDGKPFKLIAPSELKEVDKFKKTVGLVLSVGCDAYRGKRFEDSGPWCKVGDWVVIPRNEGNLSMYRGIPVVFIADDRVLCTVEDPEHVWLP